MVTCQALQDELLMLENPPPMMDAKAGLIFKRCWVYYIPYGRFVFIKKKNAKPLVGLCQDLTPSAAPPAPTLEDTNHCNHCIL